MKNFGRFYNITSKNETDFSDCPDKYGIKWNLQIKVFCILSHTENDKERL